MDYGDNFMVRYYDGSDWIIVENYYRYYFDLEHGPSGDFDNGQFYHEVIWINESDFTFPTDMKIRFQCDATNNNDDIYIDQIFVNATPGSGGSDFYYTNTYNQEGPYHYFIWANDTSGNANISTIYTFNVIDTVAPEIFNVTAVPDVQNLDGFVNISCDVLDNVDVDVVMVNVTFPDDSVYNETSLGDGSYYYNVTYGMLGTYHYFIWTNDTSGNANVSFVRSFNVSDTVAPEIFNVMATPPTSSQGDFVNISCDVVDNVGVDVVMVNITYPNSNMENISITANKTGDSYYCNRTYTLNGTYHYFIWANDTSGNANVSATYSFVIKNMSMPDMVNYSISLDSDWNLMSLPVNESIHIDNITVNYLGMNYSWGEAVSAGIVIDDVFKYDESYLTTSVLEPGEGYWMFAYDSCDLWISSNVSKTDDNVTDLLMDWNLIGLPYDESVALNDLMVYYDGDYYTWQAAISAGIVIDDVFKYDESYLTTDVLESGEGYWMFAYSDCTLLRSGP